MRILKTLYESSPKEIIGKVRYKLRGGPPRKPGLDDILSSEKNVRSQRLYDFLSRYEAIIQRVHPAWTPLDFAGKRVLEIGPGPVLGWAPLAVFLGADSVVCVEPSLNIDLLRAPRLVEKYFLNLHKDLSALYGPRLPFDRFMGDLLAKTHPIHDEFLQAEPPHPFDIMLSNSCLEHVFPPEATINHLWKHAAEGCRFLHLVDFGNHLGTRNPFEELYDGPPEAFWKRRGKQLNLLRGQEMLGLFQSSGFQAALIPYYRFEEFYQGTIHPHWLATHDRDALFLKAGLIAGPL